MISDPHYVIPDIHGHADKLVAALRLVERDGGPKARITFLGDYVDRGPASARVLDLLADGLDTGCDWCLLRGNHDQMMLEAIESPTEDAKWLLHESGAVETLASYGVGPGDGWHKVIPRAHHDLLRSTQLWQETPDLILAHAGLRPGVPLSEQTARDLMWMREPFLSDPRDHGKLVAHGHSPVPWPEHHGNRVALDGGAGWGRDLHVAVFEGRRAWVLTDEGRQPLVPRQHRV